MNMITSWYFGNVTLQKSVACMRNLKPDIRLFQ